MTGPGPVVWLDGEIRDPEVAALHWSDHGITVGDGVFETIKLVDGSPFALSRHLDRLHASARSLGLQVSDDQVRAAVDAVVHRWGAAPGRLRVTVTGGPGPMGSARGTAGPTLLVTAGALSIDRTPTDVVVSPWPRNERGALAGVKSTSYGENVMALARATVAGATEALFGNTVGMLCEGTGSNVFIGLRGRLMTPPLTSGCLAGVTRALLLEALTADGLPAVQDDIPMAELQSVDEVFLVSTTRDVQAVRSIDGRPLPACPGPLTELARRSWEHHHGPGTPTDP